MAITPPNPIAKEASADRHLSGNGMTRALDRCVRWLNRRGLAPAGSRLLEVRGRSSGLWRTTPVNPLEFEGGEYLVAPRGHTQWVRNLRAAGEGRLRLGRRYRDFSAVELADIDKPAVLRAYLRRWRWEVGAFFDGVGPDATDADLLAVASGYPVFRIESTGGDRA